MKIIQYGKYYSTDESTKEPLEWIVISSDNSYAKLIAKNVIDVKEFDCNGTNDWEKSSIRNWLNKEFYEIAFSKLEKSAIAKTKINDMPSNMYLNKIQCKDNATLLSYDDAKKLEETDIFKALFTDVNITAYAQEKSKYGFAINMNTNKPDFEWMLRTTDKIRNNVYAFHNMGHVLTDNISLTEKIGIRPVVTIKL